MKTTATLIREYGPFPGVSQVGGVTFDGKNVWMANGDQLRAFDPDSGNVMRELDVAAGRFHRDVPVHLAGDAQVRRGGLHVDLAERAVE